MNRLYVVALLALLALTIASLGIALSRSSQTVEVRITARQLDDGRVEFALQKRHGASWGERMLVGSRFFPADPGHSRWVASAPYTVSVGQVASGVEELMEEEAGSSPTVGDQEASRPPDSFPGWFEEPISEGAFSSGGIHQNGWWVLVVPRRGEDDLWASCRPDSRSLFARVGDSPWLETSLDQLLEMAANVRYEPARTFLQSDAEDVCKVVSAAAKRRVGPQPPATRYTWRQSMTTTGNTQDSVYDYVSLMFGCYYESDYDKGVLGVTAWAWSSQDSFDYGRLNPGVPTYASFAAGNDYALRTGPEYALLLGEDARAFLTQLDQHDQVTISMPLIGQATSATFASRGLVDQSTKSMLECEPLIVDYGHQGEGPVDPSELAQRPPLNGARAIAGRGSDLVWRLPYLSVSCSTTTEHWSLSLYVIGFLKGVPMVHGQRLAPGIWLVDIGGRAFPFTIYDDKATLNGAGARDFWQAAREAGEFSLEVPTERGANRLSFDLRFIDDDPMGQRTCG